MATLSDLNILDVGNTIQMAGAVYVGNGKAYLAMFPEERGTLHIVAGKVLLNQDSDGFEVEPLNLTQDDWVKFLRQTDLLETEALARAADGTIQKAILRKSQRQIEQGVMWRVYKRDHYTCRYCGNDDIPLTVDHLVRWEEGGPSIVANLLSACRKCNKTRGNLSYEDWLKSTPYAKVSQRLSEATRKANLELLETLSSIPRNNYQKSR